MKNCRSPPGPITTKKKNIKMPRGRNKFTVANRKGSRDSYLHSFGCNKCGRVFSYKNKNQIRLLLKLHCRKCKGNENEIDQEALVRNVSNHGQSLGCPKYNRSEMAMSTPDGSSRQVLVNEYTPDQLKKYMDLALVIN